MLPRIFWAGDSTVKQNDHTSFPQTGIGQGLPLYLKKDIVIVNRAENGRSTKSFIEEGRLKKIDLEIQKGDFLFIQFGHNDEKPDPERHTDPFTTYQENLATYIRVARNQNAHPVLITPLYRRLFDEKGKLVEKTHLDYPLAMKEVGEELQVPVIDLCSISKQLIQEAGPEKSKDWFLHIPAGRYPNFPDGKQDNSHLQYEGAVFFAKIIADGLRRLGSFYESLLLPLDQEVEDSKLLID
ncbi:MAG: rhamnogalacturonan acetylesterase [Clostridiales bacterium]|nr:rhamnogalacturonan acetylesterase [Clostridiales bacterium]